MHYSFVVLCIEKGMVRLTQSAVKYSRKMRSYSLQG